MDTPAAHRRDLPPYFALLGRCGLFVAVAVVMSAGPFYLYHQQLRRIGEALDAPRIAEISRDGPSLWASGFYDSAIHKPLVAERLEPQVAVLGSSRVMPWRREMFALDGDTTFYNLGGGAQNTDELTTCIDILLAQQTPPELVLIGVDWWWLQHHQATAEPQGPARERYDHWLQARKRTLDRVQLYQRAWRDPRVWQALREPDATTPTGRTAWGINARTTGGFRNDGSYSYWHFVTYPDNPRHTEERKRRTGLQRIDRGDYAGQHLHPGRLADLDDGVRRLRARGVEVVLVMTPLEPVVLDHWLATDGGRTYMPRLHDALLDISQRNDAGFADFTDPRPLGYDIAAFVDWFHGGERVYAAMLLEMSRRTGLADRLEGYLDPAQLADDLGQSGNPYTLYPG